MTLALSDAPFSFRCKQGAHLLVKSWTLKCVVSPASSNLWWFPNILQTPWFGDVVYFYWLRKAFPPENGRNFAPTNKIRVERYPFLFFPSFFKNSLEVSTDTKKTTSKWDRMKKKCHFTNHKISHQYTQNTMKNLSYVIKILQNFRQIRIQILFIFSLLLFLLPRFNLHLFFLVSNFFPPIIPSFINPLFFKSIFLLLAGIMRFLLAVIFCSFFFLLGSFFFLFQYPILQWKWADVTDVLLKQLLSVFSSPPRMRLTPF